MAKDTKFSEEVGYKNDDKPWGSYKILDQGEDFQVKRLEVEPGERLSLQAHEHRKEFWIIVQGKFEIRLGDEKDTYSSGDVIEIEPMQKHRPKCISEKNSILIEVQQGDYLVEDDIIRYDDDYGRS